MACGRQFTIDCFLRVFSLHAIENRHRYSEYTIGYGVGYGHVNRIHTMQFLRRIPRIAQQNTKGAWEFRNDALWDTL